MELDTTLIDPRPRESRGEFLLEGDSEGLAPEDMDPAEVGAPPVDSQSGQNDGDDPVNINTHILRHQQSESEITLPKLSDRLKDIVEEVGISRRATRNEALSRHHSHKHSATPLCSSGSSNAKRSSTNTKSSSHAGALEKSKTATSTFRAFWESVKQTLGFGLGGKANKLLVAVIVVAVLGSSVARLKRR